MLNYFCARVFKEANELYDSYDESLNFQEDLFIEQSIQLECTINLNFFI